jgi:hypothetical protein
MTVSQSYKRQRKNEEGEENGFEKELAEHGHMGTGEEIW